MDDRIMGQKKNGLRKVDNSEQIAGPADIHINQH